MILANNQPIGHLDIDDQIEILKKLPLGFDPPPEKPPSEYVSEACQFFTAFGENVLTQWEKDKKLNASLLPLAQKSFRLAMNEATQKGHKASWGMLAARYGDILFVKDQYDEFMSTYKEALTILNENQNGFLAYEQNGNFYSNLHQLRQKNDVIRNDQEIDFLMQDLCEQNSKLQGQYIKDLDDAEAYMVSQAEVGFSDQQRMGTNNVWTCVTVLVHDPLSKKTALAHVDQYINGDALKLIFDRMPRQATSGNPFQVRLMGGRYLGNNKIPQSSYQSYANLKKILRFLDTKHVNILSADIGSLELPDSLTVDPQSFTIKATYPKDRRVESDAYFVTNRVFDQLNIAFDLTESPLTAPILLSAAEIDTLRNTSFKMSHEALYTEQIEDRGYNQKQAIAFIGRIGAIKYSYYKALAPLIKAHADHVRKMKREGFRISKIEITKGRNLLGTLPLHIGPNAEIANAPALDFIKSDFHLIGNFKAARVNTKAIYAFNFPNCPYQNVKAPSRTVHSTYKPSILTRLLEMMA